MDTSAVRVGDIIEVTREEAGEPVPFACVAVTRGRQALVVMLTAETEAGYRAEVLEVGACE